MKESEAIQKNSIEKTLKKKRRWPRVIADLTAAGTLGALGVLATEGSTTTTPNLGLKVKAETVWQPGGGIVLHTPGPDLEIPTHKGPFGIRIDVENIPVEETIEILRDAERIGDLPKNFEDDLEAIREGVENHIKRDVVLFAVGSMGGFLIADRRSGSRNRKKNLGQKAGVAVVATAVILGGAGAAISRSYDPNAFGKRTITGDISFVENQAELFEKLDIHDSNVAQTAQNYLRLSNALNRLEIENQNRSGISVMHVSDIHGRNVFPLLRAIIETNNVDVVIDSGDITEWGQGFENEWRGVSEGISSLEVPYLIVKGNHDSVQIIKELSLLPNVEVLNGQIETINGLEIIGIPDPDYTPDDTIDGQSDRDEIYRKLGRRLNTIVSFKKPDIAVVHNPSAVEDGIDDVGMVLSGHTHVKRPVLEELESGTLHYNQGTSGGAFLRVFDKPEEQPQTISIIRFNEENKPYAMDEFIITSLDGRINLEINRRNIPCSGTCAE